MRRFLRIVRALTAGLAVTSGALLALDRLFPPDLSRYEAVSVEVLDADGRLLRAFTTADGRWRLKATPAHVDPVYLKLLKAYEDRRLTPPGSIRWRWRARPASSRRAGGSCRAPRRCRCTARLLQPQPEPCPARSSRRAPCSWMALLEGRDPLDLPDWLPFGGNIERARRFPVMVRQGAAAPHARQRRRPAVALPQSPERRRPDRHADRAHGARHRPASRP
jgi:penicillin-binding protein 1C